MRDGWVETTLKEALEPIANRPNGKDYPLVLSVTEKRGIIPQTEIFKHRIATDDISKYKVIEPMDIAYNPYLLWCGAIGQWKGAEPGVVSPVYECFRVKNNCSPKFLGFIFEAGILTEYFNSRAIGSIVRRRRTIPADFIGAPILLPPLAEQKRIVDLISSVDSYIEALQQQVDKARKSRNAVLHELLTKGGDGWVETPISEFAQVLSGYAFKSVYFNKIEGIPLIRIRDLQKRNQTEALTTETYDDRYLVRKGDILIGMDGEFRCYEWSGPVALLNQRVCRIQDFKLELVEPQFIFFTLNQYLEKIEQDTGYTTVKHISSGQILEISFPLPPLAEQKRIAGIISVFDNYVETLDSAINKTKDLRSALLSDLLSGNHEIPTTYDKQIGAA
jgi:restriction endonuclease S subunit